MILSRFNSERSFSASKRGSVELSAGNEQKSGSSRGALEVTMQEAEQRQGGKLYSSANSVSKLHRIQRLLHLLVNSLLKT